MHMSILFSLTTVLPFQDMRLNLWRGLVKVSKEEFSMIILDPPLCRTDSFLKRKYFCFPGAYGAPVQRIFVT